VAFFYIRHNSPFLRQGEIIANLLEPRLRIAELTAIDVNQPAKVDPIHHPYSMIVSQDCDLEWDYKARTGEAPGHKVLTHMLFCELFSRDDITDQSKRKSQAFGLIKDKQDQRYHYLEEATVNGTEESLPELIADFKTTFSLPVELVYWLLSNSQAVRKGALHSPYLEDFMHRLYTFLGRVATP
jgi:hypothetical protein